MVRLSTFPKVETVCRKNVDHFPFPSKGRYAPVFEVWQALVKFHVDV